MDRVLTNIEKLSVYQMVSVATLNYGHELWVVIKRMACRQKFPPYSSRDKTQKDESSDMRRELSTEPLFLGVENRQTRWSVHQISVYPEDLTLEVFWACPTGSWPSNKPRQACWWNYSDHLRIPYLGCYPFVCRLCLKGCEEYDISNDLKFHLIFNSHQIAATNRQDASVQGKPCSKKGIVFRHCRSCV